MGAAKRLAMGRSIMGQAAFAMVFTPPASYTVTSVTSANFTVNPSFDGNGNPELLAAGNTLGINQTGVIQIVLHVNSGGKPGPYTCSGTAMGTSPAGVPVTDVSQDGDDPDPDGNGNPNDKTYRGLTRERRHRATSPSSERQSLPLIALMTLIAADEERIENRKEKPT